MSKRTGIRLAILNERKKGESRLAQAVRLGLPESTLRWCEVRNLAPRNKHVRANFFERLGLTEQVAK